MAFVLPQPPRKGRARPEPGTRLSRESIVDAALAIVDAGGLDALSMRSVAQALRTGPASLYAHVADKDELLALLIERVAGGHDLPDPDPEHWQEQLKGMVRSLHHGLLAHRDLARAALGTIPLGEGALRFRDRMIAVMRAGRLPDRVVAYGCDLLPLYAVATACEQAAHADEEGARFVEAVRAYVAALPGDRFPHLLAVGAPALGGAEDGERFEFGLDVLVSGLAAYGPRT
jgi:AcrR family transcriptional regulator